MQFDRAKLRAAILHTCRATRPDNLGAVKLHKVLYYLDMRHFAQAGSAVTGATYRKRPFGPTCQQLLPTLREMANEQLLEIHYVDFFGHRKTEYHALAKVEPGVLNESELAVLDEVIDFVCERNSARSISELSHQLPWEMVEFGDEIPYSSALLLYPVEVTPEAFEATEEGLGELAAERFNANPVGFTKLSDFRRSIQAEIGHR
jgi:Protein of unknown function (DUF4065)